MVLFGVHIQFHAERIDQVLSLHCPDPVAVFGDVITDGIITGDQLSAGNHGYVFRMGLLQYFCQGRTVDGLDEEKIAAGTDEPAQIRRLLPGRAVRIDGRHFTAASSEHVLHHFALSDCDLVCLRRHGNTDFFPCHIGVWIRVNHHLGARSGRSGRISTVLFLRCAAAAKCNQQCENQQQCYDSSSLH